MNAVARMGRGRLGRVGWLTWTVAGLAALAPVPPATAQEASLDEQESYSYVRTLEGRATLASTGSGPGEEAELNQPLMAGDRIEVGRGARMEIALADRNLLRIGEDASVTLERIAFSGDRDDRTTRIDLARGEIVLVVGDDALGDELPEVRAGGVEVVIHRPGTYRIETWSDGTTEVVVRDGYAEVVSRDGSSVLRDGEMAIAAEGGYDLEIADASPAGSLERWGDELADAADRADTRYVEPELAYRSASLAQHGSWVAYNSSWYWQPRVEVGWRPYWRGRWGWTPSGLTWVSYEPWGWVPYHYGSWCRLPGYGWAWRPGRQYSPAWVYWHWTDSYVGWCPTGYYTSWYDPWYRDGFRWGYYGWAGGSWGNYRDWCFRPTRRVCDRDWRRWHRGSHDLERELGPTVPRGVITTDTGGIPRRRFEEPGLAEEIVRRGRLRGEGSNADVTDFVARRRDLPPAVETAIQPGPRDRRRLRDEPASGDRTRVRVAGPNPRDRRDIEGTDGAPGDRARRRDDTGADGGAADGGRARDRGGRDSGTEGQVGTRSRRTGEPTTPQGVPGDDRRRWREGTDDDGGATRVRPQRRPTPAPPNPRTPEPRERRDPSDSRERRDSTDSRERAIDRESPRRPPNPPADRPTTRVEPDRRERRTVTTTPDRRVSPPIERRRLPVEPGSRVGSYGSGRERSRDDDREPVRRVLDNVRRQDRDATAPSYRRPETRPTSRYQPPSQSGSRERVGSPRSGGQSSRSTPPPRAQRGSGESKSKAGSTSSPPPSRRDRSDRNRD